MVHLSFLLVPGAEKQRNQARKHTRSDSHHATWAASRHSTRQRAGQLPVELSDGAITTPQQQHAPRGRRKHEYDTTITCQKTPLKNAAKTRHGSFAYCRGRVHLPPISFPVRSWQSALAVLFYCPALRVSLFFVLEVKETTCAVPL